MIVNVFWMCLLCKGQNYFRSVFFFFGYDSYLTKCFLQNYPTNDHEGLSHLIPL
jgi:hypothetical protein